jgi:hypothetical protein
MRRLFCAMSAWSTPESDFPLMCSARLVDAVSASGFSVAPWRHQQH